MTVFQSRIKCFLFVGLYTMLLDMDGLGIALPTRRFCSRMSSGPAVHLPQTKSTR